MEKSEKILRIKFALYPGLGPGTMHKIFLTYSSLIELGEDYQKGQLKEPINGKLERFIKTVDESETRSLCDFYRTVKAANLKLVVLGEELYPQYLSQIPDHPILLFYRGDIGILKNNEKLVSVVGTRGFTDYGIAATEKFVSVMAKYDYTIISGMAFGIDATAHQAAIKNGAKTVAVLASSADKPTPAGNEYLYNQILENGGLILSETFPGDQCRPEYFPRRNRIIAGLSRHLLVTEAGKRSGALITAQQAFDYARNVMVVPAAITRQDLQGTNKLANREQAKIIYNVDRLLYELGIRTWKEKVKRKEVQLNEFEKEIVDVLKKDMKTLDDLVDLFDNKYSILLASLTEMEMKGVIKQDQEGRYFYIY